MIKYWLKNGTVTWEALARAVERVGGHKHLVTRLRSRKATDELVEGAACMGDERSDNTEFEPSMCLLVV